MIILKTRDEIARMRVAGQMVAQVLSLLERAGQTWNHHRILKRSG